MVVYNFCASAPLLQLLNWSIKICSSSDIFSLFLELVFFCFSSSRVSNGTGEKKGEEIVQRFFLFCLIKSSSFFQVFFQKKSWCFDFTFACFVLALRVLDFVSFQIHSFRILSKEKSTAWIFVWFFQTFLQFVANFWGSVGAVNKSFKANPLFHTFHWGGGF